MSNPYSDYYVPECLWPAQIGLFGTDVSYWPAGDRTNAFPLTGVWKDGTEDEQVSPGRYSRLYVLNSDLPMDPAEDDMVEADTGQQYDVVLVKAFPYGASELTLHETGATL